jgi:hypothetical protein
MGLKINDSVTVNIAANYSGIVGKITGIASYIPTNASDLFTVTFDEAITNGGATSVCVPEWYLTKVN